MKVDQDGATSDQVARRSSACGLPWHLLAAGVFIFASACHFRSLWLDEFHTLNHARAPDLGAFFASVRADNHPPLLFLLVRWSIRLLGESHFSIRLPSLLAGLSCLWLSSSLCRRLPDRPARALGGWMLLGSSCLLLVSTEARMYSLEAMAVLGLLSSILRLTEGGGSAWWIVLWTAVGMHSHYYFGVYLAVLGLTVVGLWLLRWQPRPVLLPILSGLMGGCVLFLPWFFWGFTSQLDSKLQPGANSASLAEWVESIVHLLFIGTGPLGRGFLYGVVLPGSLAAMVLGLLGIRRLWTAPAADRRHPRTRGTLLLLLVAMALVTPLVARLIGSVAPRVSYNWRYIAGSCAPLVILVAAGLRERGRVAYALGGVVLCTLFTATLFNAVSAGREDYRGAALHILERSMPGDVVLINPTWYAAPETSPTGWDYYSERLAASRGAIPPPQIRTIHWQEALSHPRVWALVRGHFPLPVLNRIRQSFPREEVTRISGAVEVHLFHGRE